MSGTGIDGEVLDGVNCNLYDSMAQYLSWHADSEPLFKKKNGEATGVSISFGLARQLERQKEHDKNKCD